jgi:hypothetical protein
MSRYLVAIAAMPAMLAGCGTDRNSADPPASAGPRRSWCRRPSAHRATNTIRRSDPTAAGAARCINSNRDGTGAIYRAARLADGSFAPPVEAGHPFLPHDGDLSFAPDGSFIIVSAQRPRVGGSFRNDLFISFRQADGRYADFVELDDTINTPAHEWCPMVTPDGKYLFFSRRFGAYDTQGWDGTTGGDVFWVDVRALDKYRTTAR